MIKDRSIAIETGGVRLDAALLLHFPTSSRTLVRAAIAKGEVLVNGRPAVKGLKLRGGETVVVSRLLEASDNHVAPNPAVHASLVHEDAALLAFDKPVCLPVQPLSCDETGTLMNGVVAAYPECAAVGDNPLMAGALHRIDAGTSGLVLVARNQDAFDRLRAQFAAQSVRKTYLALVEGTVADCGTLENDLVHDPTLPYCRMLDARRNRLTMAEKAKLRPMHAVTSFVPVGCTRAGNEVRTLLEVVIYTGVTHQIRAQLAGAGMHIVNDRLYGAFAVEGQVGHCLHALSAEFVHPATGEKTKIATPLPAWATETARQASKR